MKVSIVIPAYNAGKHLTETLRSVQSQTVSDWELIVVDDGSRDDTRTIAENFAQSDRRVRVIPQPNSGVAAARNHGLALTSPETPYLAFLDHDDVWEPKALQGMIRVLEDQPALVAVHGLARFIDARGRSLELGVAEEYTLNRSVVAGKHLIALGTDEPTTFSSLVYTNCIWTPGQVLIRKALMPKVGPLDGAAVPADDYDLWLRLATHGDLAFINEVVIGFRRHESNGSLDRTRLNQAEDYVYRKTMCSRSLSPEQRRLAILGFRHRQRHLSHTRMVWAKQQAREKQFGGAAKQVYHSLRSYGRSLNLFTPRMPS